ncbi:uncharacterized protein PPOP_3871, partial [Paenibacillus popilliae ATCC 14706]
ELTIGNELIIDYFGFANRGGYYDPSKVISDDGFTVRAFTFGDKYIDWEAWG